MEDGAASATVLLELGLKRPDFIFSGERDGAHKERGGRPRPSTCINIYGYKDAHLTGDYWLISVLALFSVSGVNNN